MKSAYETFKHIKTWANVDHLTKIERKKMRIEAQIEQLQQDLYKTEESYWKEYNKK